MRARKNVICVRLFAEPKLKQRTTRAQIQNRLLMGKRVNNMKPLPKVKNLLVYVLAGLLLVLLRMTAAGQSKATPVQVEPTLKQIS